MAIIRCLDEEKLNDGKKRTRTFFSYAEDADKEIIGSIIKDLDTDERILYTADPAAAADDAFDAELAEMEDLVVYPTLSLFTSTPARTLLHDIPYMLKKGIRPMAIERKDNRTISLLMEIFFTLCHTKGEEKLDEEVTRQVLTETIRVVTRDHAQSIPKELNRPLYQARMELCREILEHDPESELKKIVYITSLLNWGNLNRTEKNYDEALSVFRDAYLRATKLSETLPSWDSHICAAKASVLTATIHDDLKDERKAKRWYRRCVEEAEVLKNDKGLKGHPEMPDLDTVYIDSLIHLAAMAERDGELRDALDMLFKADLAIKEYPHLVPEEVIKTIGLHIDELASHVLSGMEG